MKIRTLLIRNYRSIELLELTFSSFYSSLCGKNNAGKTNVIKAINAVLGPDEDDPFEVAERLNSKRDFPVWKSKEAKGEKIEISVDLLLSGANDTGLFKFVTTFLG